MRKLIKKGTTEEEPAPQHSKQRDIANSKRAQKKGETNIICLECGQAVKLQNFLCENLG